MYPFIKLGHPCSKTTSIRKNNLNYAVHDRSTITKAIIKQYVDVKSVKLNFVKLTHDDSPGANSHLSPV